VSETMLDTPFRRGVIFHCPRGVIIACPLTLAAAVLSVWFFGGFRVDTPPAAVPPAEDRFEMNYVRIAGQPADSYIFQPSDSGMTLIWAEKKGKRGLP